MPVFFNENVARGLPANAPFQVGVSDADNGGSPEKNFTLPWYLEPEATYEEYQCWVDYELDSGIVVHPYLPQSAQPYDTLATADVTDIGFAARTDGPNLKSLGNFSDVAQRMANSKYRFCLRGYCVRVGWVPCVPGLKYIGVGGSKVAVVPDDERPQRVKGPVIIGNNMGIPAYFLGWRLWYTVLTPPKGDVRAPTNLAQRIGQTKPPTAIQVPVSLPDGNASRSEPPQVRDLQNPLLK